MNKFFKKSTKDLVIGALIAAIYVALTMIFRPISFGAIQVRISEALVVLPVFTISAVPGVFIGCLLANLLAGGTVLDIVFGSLATLLAAYLTYKLRKTKLLYVLPPIIINALVIPFVLRYSYGVPDLIPFLMLSVGVGEVISVGILGSLLKLALAKYEHILFLD